MSSMNTGILLQSQPNCDPLLKADGWQKNMKSGTKNLKTDIAMLLQDGKEQIHLVEVFCSPTSTMTKTAQSAGLKAERWTKEFFDVSKPSGCQLAMERLKELKPKRLWPSPECGPYSIMQNANQRTPQQAEALRKKRELAFRQWQHCIRLA